MGVQGTYSKNVTKLGKENSPKEEEQQKLDGHSSLDKKNLRIAMKILTLSIHDTASSIREHQD
jgi:hypothetical protein